MDRIDAAEQLTLEVLAEPFGRRPDDRRVLLA